MSIEDIKPEECPSDLKAAIEKLMREKKFTWRETLVFLAMKVISPIVS